ncbi:MAG TPA: hypothetical protein VEM15_09745 [Thermodesulfobacteriota bacterium]|nr:hypothetical protein [Thermodesulfobacteriota bacterium]
MSEADKILEEKTEETIRRMINKGMVSESLTAAVEYKFVDKLCDTIGAASGDFVRQSVHLQQCVEGANDNFVAESRAFRESMGGIRSSLRKFRESNERASKALTRATYVLAGVALIQAVILILQWLK